MMKNIPSRIFLQHGAIEPDDFNELSIKDITWSTDQINSDDIEYFHHDQFKTDTPVKEVDWDELRKRFIEYYVIDNECTMSANDITAWFATNIGGEK
jgi:hypothetical protein